MLFRSQLAAVPDMNLQRRITLLSPCQYFPLFLRVYSHRQGYVLLFVVILLVAQGDLLLPLLGEGFAVAVRGHRISWRNGLSRLFHTATTLNQSTNSPSEIGMAQSHARLGRGKVTRGRRKRLPPFFFPACSLRSSN